MKYEGSIKKRLIVIIMAVSLLTTLVGYGSFVYWYMGNQYDRALNLSKTVGLVLGQDFAKLVLLNDVSAAADISTSLKSFSNLDSMVLYNLDKKPILQYSKENKSFEVETLPSKQKRESIINDDILKLYIDAKYENTNLGYVQLNLEIETIFEVVKRNLNILILILGIMFILSYLLATYFAKKFTNPILNLVTFLEKVEEIDSLDKRIDTNERNEFGKLYDEINVMLERIENSHKELKIAAVAFETQNGITITDKNQNILQVNRAFTNITGYEADDVIGVTPKILQSGLHTKEFYDEMKTSLKERNFWIGEINNRHKDGSIVNEHLTIQVVLDDNSEVLYYVASFLDITFQKEIEAELKDKENLLIQKSKMAEMGEMIENIAHQWKQPLSIISMAATSILLKRDLDMPMEKQEEEEQLSLINDNVKYLSHTIDDFREFFKTDKEKGKFNLKDCYKKVLNLVESKIKSLDIELVENLNDVNLITLENELVQVIINILNNAKDVLQNKKDQRKLIFIDIYKEEDKAVLTIKDSGGGVPEDIINRIFEPYFTTKAENGTGIGLNMSKEMITKHMNGKISVENSTYIYEDVEYTGAVFKISIPIKN